MNIPSPLAQPPHSRCSFPNRSYCSLNPSPSHAGQHMEPVPWQALHRLLTIQSDFVNLFCASDMNDATFAWACALAAVDAFVSTLAPPQSGHTTVPARTTSVFCSLSARISFVLSVTKS